MPSRGSNPIDDQAHRRAPRHVPPCAICNGTMIIAYDRHGQKMCVCLDCHTSMTIPGSAWDVALGKRLTRERQATDRRQHRRRRTDSRVDS